MHKPDSEQFIHPAKRARRRLIWIATGVSSLFSLLLIALLFALGKNEPSTGDHIRNEEVIDLLNSPQPENFGVEAISSSQIAIELPKGGWVQQTDRYGNLVQQYRCESLDPNPPSLPTGWIEMHKPEIELFLSDNRIVRITGDVGIANAPNRVLETGKIIGHVEVSMFDLQNGATLTPETTPSVVLTTQQASFDNFIGEITCDSDVRIVSPKQILVGRQLTVRFNDKEERIEYLRLEELDFIEFIQDDTPAQSAEPTPTPLQSEPSNRQTGHRIHATAIGEPIEYYIVTLFTRVQIVQGVHASDRFAKADKLTISFSNEQDSSVSSRTHPVIPSSMVAMGGIPTTIVAASLNSFQSPSVQTIRITCDGGLTMIPLDDASLMPTTPQDTRLELFGSLDTPVYLKDSQQGLVATGEFLRHEVLQDRSDLYGSPASLLMNEMVTTANHLWIARQDGQGAVVGPGTMTDAVQQSVSTTLQWSEGVDLSFDTSETGDSGALTKVVCHGDVVLTSAQSVVTCETLDIAFDKGIDGSSNPSLAIATGDVKVKSDTQILFADEAHVSFIQDVAGGSDEDSMFGGSKADKMKATGNVQVLLKDAGRAFCDQLDGHISQDIATLTGNVLIAYERMLINRGETATLTLDRVSGKGRWEGSGQALFLEEVLDVHADNRIDRPVIQSQDEHAADYGRISMRANWISSMKLDQRFNDGAGALDLSGEVDVRSRQSPLERGQMTGEDLRLEFQYLDNVNDSENPTRELQRIIARNNAQIEHRLWDAADSKAPPVVYYIGGNHIEYDASTREALVVGDGELVLRDPREAKEGTHQSALAGRGTTRFTWENKLKTTKITENLYRIEMGGNVEMVHQGLDGVIGMLTSDNINAFARDPNPDIAMGHGVSKLTFPAMDLQQLSASGNVYVATTTRKVDCDEFEYNLLTGIAQLTSLENRTVAIVTQGTTYPVRATSITWNMDPAVDTISIHGLQGSSPN